MASNEVPTQGQDVDNTPQWLKDVKADADFNYRRLLREQEDRAAHEAQKAAQQSNGKK